MSPTRSTTSRDSAAGQQARVRQPQSKQEHVPAGVAPVVEGALRGVDADSRLSAPVRVRGSTHSLKLNDNDDHQDRTSKTDASSPAPCRSGKDLGLRALMEPEERIYPGRDLTPLLTEGMRSMNVSDRRTVNAAPGGPSSSSSMAPSRPSRSRVQKCADLDHLDTMLQNSGPMINTEPSPLEKRLLGITPPYRPSNPAPPREGLLGPESPDSPSAGLGLVV